MSTQREHGTEAGYTQHRREGEQACGHCLWAHRAYNKQSRALLKARRERKPTVAPPASPRPLAPVVIHGTPQALALHARSSRPVCEVCLTAACDWEREQARRYLQRRTA